MSKSVTFTIENGTVELEAQGFKGGACEVATKAFEEVLGGPITGKRKKAEFYEKPEQVKIGVGHSK